MASDPIDELRRTAYPNPERIGCPGPEVFEALRNRQIAFDDPVWNHIERCSPCYSQFTEIRDGLFKQEGKSERQTVSRLVLAAVLVLAIGAGIYYANRSRAGTQDIVTVAGNRPESAVLNFEDGSEIRGFPDSDPGKRDQPKSAVQHLPRNQLNLIVYLPLGSPAGLYRLEMLAPGGKVVWHAEGMALIKDGLTSLPVSGDLRNLAIGQYKFRFHREDETWHEKDVIVQ